MSRTWRIAGINFDHFHMGDLLQLANEHAGAEIVGVADPDPGRMQPVVGMLGIEPSRVFSDFRECLRQTEPDVVILCPATADHAQWTEWVAEFDVHVLIEKPFAASLADADRMIRAMAATGRQLAINWPLRWYPPHATAYRLVQAGQIGDVVEVHYYDGNRGPLWHGANKVEREPTSAEKDASWFYRRAAGGGSLLDYLGYGTTLGTWYLQNREPLEITCIVDAPPGLEVDEHSITVVRYPFGLSKFETRWGTFTDPWTHQPQPKCGIVLRGTEGTLASYDYEQTISLQTGDHPAVHQIPVDTLAAPFRNPVEYFLHCLETETPVEGPLSPMVSRIGQKMVDAACRSAQEKRTVAWDAEA